MAQDTVQNDLDVNGALTCRQFNPPAGCVIDASVLAGANVAATKLQHRHMPKLAQANGVVAAAERRVIHIAKASGTITLCKATVTVAAIGDSTATFDVKKNDTTILTGTVTFTSSDVAYTLKSGTLAVTTFVASDVFEVVITVSAGTGTLPKGLVVELTLDENGT